MGFYRFCCNESELPRKHCLDVSVKRRACCKTDQHLVCTRLKLEWRFRKNTNRSSNHESFDIGKLGSSRWVYSGCAVSYYNIVERPGQMMELWKRNGRLWVLLCSYRCTMLGILPCHQLDWLTNAWNRLHTFIYVHATVVIQME